MRYKPYILPALGFHRIDAVAPKHPSQIPLDHSLPSPGALHGERLFGFIAFPELYAGLKEQSFPNANPG